MNGWDWSVRKIEDDFFKTQHHLLHYEQKLKINIQGGAFKMAEE